MARCVVVLADGLRPDAVTRTHMPTLRALGHDYTRAASATTVRPSVTVAALASFATGVSPETHGLVEPGLGFLTRLAGLRPLARELGRYRIRTLVAAGAPAIRSRPVAWALTACAGVDRLVLSEGGARGTVEGCLPHLADHEFAFVYLPDCDRAGHAHGWMSPAYLREASHIDAAIASLAIRLDKTLLIVLADHGGGGVHPTDHDAPHLINDAIPVVLAGRGVRHGHVIAGPVSLLDIPPTILRWFGAAVPPGYEGRPLEEAFVTPVPEGAAA